MIENYRQVANLCSVPKIFERIILNRIMQLESLGDVDIMDKQRAPAQVIGSTM